MTRLAADPFDMHDSTDPGSPRPAPRPAGSPLFSVAPRNDLFDVAASAAAAAAVAAADDAARRADSAVPEGHFGSPPPAASTPAASAAAVPVPVVAAGPSMALARPNDGLPVALDPYAVAMRSVQVLIGSPDASRHIARRAIEMSIEHDSSAALDVVIPRAIDLVLRRAAHLVSVGVGARVVDHYTERLELWRRLACRRGLEPAAIVLTLAPFPIPSVATMLRVPVAEIEACITAWYAGIDPDEHLPAALPPAPAPAPTPPMPAPPMPSATQGPPAAAGPHGVADVQVVPIVAEAPSPRPSRSWIRWRAKGA